MVIKQKIKPYSPTQIRKMCISMLKDVKAEYPDIENKDAAYILSEEFLSEDEYDELMEDEGISFPDNISSSSDSVISM